ARTAEDCAIVLEAIAGPDADDRTASGKRFRPLAARAAASAAKRARVGYAEEDVADHASTEGKAALAKGVAELRKVVPHFARAARAQPTERPGNTGMLAAGNLAGLPASFFPCGFAPDGLPVGLQLVGPPFSEALLVAIVAAYQGETGHHLKRPRD